MGEFYSLKQIGCYIFWEKCHYLCFSKKLRNIKETRKY